MKKIELKDVVVLQRPLIEQIEGLQKVFHYGVYVNITFPIKDQKELMEATLAASFRTLERFKERNLEVKLTWLNRILDKAIKDLYFEKKNPDTKELERFEIDSTRVNEIDIIKNKLSELLDAPETPYDYKSFVPYGECILTEVEELVFVKNEIKFLQKEEDTIENRNKIVGLTWLIDHYTALFDLSLSDEEREKLISKLNNRSENYKLEEVI